ncbi:MAG: hypothetical protein K2F82_08040 [Muribaculaceae bacterium]|nr:hypothetical protein [Muribaculaceae bacterium]
MNKPLCITLAVMAGSLALSAQSMTEWQNHQVNEINRMPSRAAFYPYTNAASAAANTPDADSNYLSLNGLWKFNWVNNANERPTDFFKVGFNDSGWAEMPVPGMWELHGYGDPQYVNVGYGWRNDFSSDPPRVPEAKNHVGSYRRMVEIPADWSGRDIIAHFGSVTSNIYLWVNGRFVGYSEDSKLETEFDLTKYQ